MTTVSKATPLPSAKARGAHSPNPATTAADTAATVAATTHEVDPNGAPTERCAKGVNRNGRASHRTRATQFKHAMQAAPHPHHNSLPNAFRRRSLFFGCAAERITPVRSLPGDNPRLRGKAIA
jgi:hypothetical protein